MKVKRERTAPRSFAALVLLALVGAVLPCRAQSKPNQAGEIRALVPTGHVLRGAEPAIPAQLRDPLYWRDTIRTERGGRVRIGLFDGSILNVGSQSSLTITQHDSATQQTELELTYGRVRARAARIVQRGGSFKVRTPVAVTGVVGTRFDVTTTKDTTVVLCLEDTVRVRNADDRVEGEVTLHAGEFTRVLQGRPPTLPSPASQEQLRQSEDGTSISTLPVELSRVEISWPPPGCGQESTLMLRAWSRQTHDGKETETPVDPELVSGKLILGNVAVATEGGRAMLASAPGRGVPEGRFVPEGKQVPIPTKIWPPMKVAEGKGWRAPRAAFVGRDFYVFGAMGANRQMAFTFGEQPATVLWVGPCGTGFRAPMVPGGAYQVALYVGGRAVARGQMNLVQISYDMPNPPAVLRGQTTKFGVELRGLAGLDKFVAGRPIGVTTVNNMTPAILGELRSQTPGASANSKRITYRVGAANIDASGTARLDATGRGRQKGEFELNVESKLDKALEVPSPHLTLVQPGP